MGITLDEVLDLMGELLECVRGVESPSSVKICMASPVRQMRALPTVTPDFTAVSVPVQPEVVQMAAFLLADDQEVDLGLDLRDRFGNKTKPVGVPAWNVSDPSLLTLKPSADGLECLVQTVGKVGGAQVTVKVRRSNNPDDVITGVQDFEIGASETTFVGLVTSPARDIGTQPTTTTTPTTEPTTVDNTGGTTPAGPQGAQGGEGPQGVQGPQGDFGPQSFTI